MISHDINELEMQASDSGEMILPSEEGPLTVAASLRQFIIQCRRNYSHVALQAMEETEQLNLRDSESTDADFFGLVLKFKPQGDVREFAQESGDDFFNDLLALVGRSELRGMRGNRAAFVREIHRTHDMNYGEILETKILVSTSVFFNDYRVTTGFPGTERELTQVTEEIYRGLCNRWPSLKLDLTWERVDYQTEELWT